MFCYIWEYQVLAERRSEFEAGYGPDGEWAHLFKRDPAWIRTDLLHDMSNPLRFVTVDYWTSREAFISFRARFRHDFDSIDARFESTTSRELHLGDFDLPSPSD